MSITPYKNLTTTKKQQVEAMFDNIAPNYDLLNHVLSCGIDILWRRKVIGLLKKYDPKYILDVATGTGDFAVEAIKLNPTKVYGVDISEEMLAVGKEKVQKKGLTEIIELQKGDAENLPFEDNKFDAITVGFGVRNFENLEKGLSDMYRVLKTDGVIAILEFSKPKMFLFKQVYEFYFLKILPLIGKLISKDSTAYTYLPESVIAFPDADDFLKILKDIGYKETKCIPLTFGISSIYIARK
ncbi:MAG: bifunctional demethylmenaquinone methyltransferase/2-methoxy-6-polyprenyl-1,4-benzoquinol methylase UbiE [Bacteroidetes bacterium]|nr:MAG: bifunctional demethylmenaquinone methyltransferase/2-methoxy-6-polyprenyl-1,4-benzoquinol methylase UbiE [Bacteroidota bacterium]